VRRYALRTNSACRLRDTGRVEDRQKRSLLERGVAVMRDGNGVLCGDVLPDVVAAADAVQHIAVRGKDPLDLARCKWLHAQARARRVRVARAGRSLSMAIDRYASRQPCAASMTLARVSAFVSPSETQPGMAGISPQYPPSAALCRTIVHPFSLVKNSLTTSIVSHCPRWNQRAERTVA